METNFSNSSLGEGSKNLEWTEINFLPMYDMHQHSKPQKPQTPPKILASLPYEQQMQQDQMIGGLHLAYQQALRTAAGHQSQINEEKLLKNEYQKQHLGTGIDSIKLGGGGNSYPSETPLGSILNFTNFDSISMGLRANAMPPYHDIAGYDINMPILTLPQPHVILKPDYLCRPNPQQPKHTSLPSLSQAPYWPYSQPIQFPSALPSLTPHIYGIPRQPINSGGYPGIGLNSMSMPPMLTNPTSIGSNINVPNVNFLHVPGGYIPSQLYGAPPQMPIAAINHGSLNTAMSGMNTNMYSHHIPSTLFNINTQVETDEDEKRKANQRRRKAESRKRLRERDPIGYREKEAKARRDRRMKQRARLSENNEPVKLHLTRKVTLPAEKDVSGLNLARDVKKTDSASSESLTQTKEISFDIDPSTDDETLSENNRKDDNDDNQKLHLQPQFAEDMRQAKRFKALSQHPKKRNPTSSNNSSQGEDDTASGSSDYATSNESSLSSNTEITKQ